MHYKPCLVIFSGLSFTGKSALSSELSKSSNFQHIESDSYRYNILGHNNSLPDKQEENVMLECYKSMHEDILRKIANGYPVCVAATYYRKTYKPLLDDLIRNLKVPLKIFVLNVEESYIPSRIVERLKKGDVSDIKSMDQYLEMKRNYDPITYPSIALNTASPILETLKQVRSFLKDLEID